MNIPPINDEAGHHSALQTVSTLLKNPAQPGTAEAEHCAALVDRVAAWETEPSLFPDFMNDSDRNQGVASPDPFESRY